MGEESEKKTEFVRSSSCKSAGAQHLSRNSLQLIYGVYVQIFWPHDLEGCIDISSFEMNSISILNLPWIGSQPLGRKEPMTVLNHGPSLHLWPVYQLAHWGTQSSCWFNGLVFFSGFPVGFPSTSGIGVWAINLKHTKLNWKGWI